MNGMPASATYDPSPKAAMPDSATWARDTWPTKPVTTTRLSARMMPISELLIPLRYSKGSQIDAARTASTNRATGTGRMRSA